VLVQTTLPNGIRIFHRNSYETDFLYREIFERRVYFQNGIGLGPDAFVVDAGANIGLFSLFVKHELPSARIAAFEPAPELEEILHANLAPFRGSVQVFAQGLGEKDGEAEFVSYPGYSLLSGFHADPVEDRATLEREVRRELGIGPETGERDANLVRWLVSDKVAQASKSRRALVSLSTFLKGRRERVDLLKIDAERSEIEILRGIGQEDWPRIRQVVLEAHGPEALAEAQGLLRERGFRVTPEREAFLSLVYAVRA
jgi:FkbM family methyltransferase